MKRNYLIKLILISFLGLVIFYKYMTYDRSYVWSKDYSSQVIFAIQHTDFRLYKKERINPESIDLSNGKRIKLKIQKALNKINLMNYGKEFGQAIILKSVNGDQKLICKAWCLSDHVIGIEIEHQDIDKNTLLDLKQRFTDQFSNYEIIWKEK